MSETKDFTKMEKDERSSASSSSSSSSESEKYVITVTTSCNKATKKKKTTTAITIQHRGANSISSGKEILLNIGGINNVSAEAGTSGKERKKTKKKDAERKLNKPEYYTIDDDDSISMKSIDSIKIISSERIQPVKKLTKYSEFGAGDLIDKDGGFGESQLFADNFDTGCCRTIKLKDEEIEGGGQIHDDDSDIVVLSDSDDDDNTWYRRLLQAQLRRESRQCVNEYLGERTEIKEEFGERENELSGHQNTTAHSSELSFSKDFNNNSEESDSADEFKKERVESDVENRFSVKDTVVCKETDKTRSNGSITSVKTILRTEETVDYTNKVQICAGKQAHDVNEQKRKVERACDQNQNRDENRCAEKRRRNDNRSNEEEISSPEKRIRKEKQYGEKQLSRDVERWLYQCIPDENSCYSKYDRNEKCSNVERNVYEENQPIDENKSRDENRAHGEKRSHEEKLSTEEMRNANERRTSDKKRSPEEKQLVKERRSSDKKRSAGDKALVEEKRSSDEKRSAEKKRLSKERQCCDERQSCDEERRSSKEKRSAEEKGLANKKRSSDEKRSAEEKGLAKERRSSDEKKSAEEKGLAKERRSSDEKRSAEEKGLAKERRSSDEKKSAEEKGLAKEKRSSDEKRSAEEKGLAKERRSSDEKRSAEEKGLAKERRSSDEKRSAEEKRLAKERRCCDERQSSVEERRSSKEEQRPQKKRSTDLNLSVEAKQSAEGNRFAKEKRSFEGKLADAERRSRDASHDRKVNQSVDMRQAQDKRRFNEKKSDHMRKKSANRDSVSEADSAKMSEHSPKSHKLDVGKQLQVDAPGISDNNSKSLHAAESISKNGHVLKDPRLMPNSYPIVLLRKLKKTKEGVGIDKPSFLAKSDHKSASLNFANVSKSPDQTEGTTESQGPAQRPPITLKKAGPKLSKRDLARKATIERRIHRRDQRWRRIKYPWANALPISKQPHQKFSSAQRDAIRSYRKEMLRKIAEPKSNAETDVSAATSVPVLEDKATEKSPAIQVAEQSVQLTEHPRGYLLFSKPLERTKKKSTNLTRISVEERRETLEKKTENSESTSAEDEANGQDIKNGDENSEIRDTPENVAEEPRIEISESLKESEVSDLRIAPVLPKTMRRVSFDDSTTKVHVFEIEPGNILRKFDPKEYARLQIAKQTEPCDERYEEVYPRKEEFLSQIFQWSPKWLEEQERAETPPPIVDEGKLVAMLSKYRTFEEYYKIAEPLLVLETWYGISKDFKFGVYSRNMFSIVTNSVQIHPIYNTNVTVSTLTLEIVVSERDLHSQAHPVYGDLLFFEYLTNTRNEHGFQSWTVFAYVTDLRKTVITPSTQFNYKLINSVKDPHTLLTLTVMTKALNKIDVQTNIVSRLKTVTYLRSNIRLVQALQCLPTSPLIDVILHPNVEDYQLPIADNLDGYSLVTKDQLNTKQMEAVMRITEAVVQEIPKICLIQGPPGTGKSRVIVNLVMQILYGDNRYHGDKKIRILLCAPSNAAIDEIVLRLLDVRNKSFGKEDRFNMVRIGLTETMHPLAKTVSLKKLAGKYVDKSDTHSSPLSGNIVEDESGKTERRRLDKMYRNAEDTLLRKADVIASTLSSCYTNQMESIFVGSEETISVCIVDEATQSTEPQTLIPLMLGVRTLVLVGDTNQLPPTVLSQKAKKLGLDQSLFARIWHAFKGETNNPIIQLVTQYRMSAPIALFPNDYFYDGLLTNAANMHKLPFHFYRVINLDSTQDREKFCNTDEANFVASLVYTIIARTNYGNTILPVKVGIITPYNDHKIMLTKKIKERIDRLKDKHKIVYEVNTIDSFQGQERDVIIMSCVRSNGIGFLSDRQRLCVALTRAKHSLILCGNFRTFLRDPMWNALLTDARNRGVYVNVNSNAYPEDITSHIIR